MAISMARRPLALLAAAACMAGAAALAAPAALANNRPVITITSPSAGATLTTNSVTVAFSENRSPKQIRSLTCALSGPVPSASAPCQTPSATATGSSSGISYSGLTNGDYTLTITLTLTDGGGTTATRDFTVAIAPPPVYIVSVEGVTNSTDAHGDTTHPSVLVVPEFTDPSGYPLTVTVSSQPASGTVTSNGDGTFTYTPTAAAQNAVAYYDLANVAASVGLGDLAPLPSPAPFTTDSFTLTADDGHGGTVSHVVTVPISPDCDMKIGSDYIETCTAVGSDVEPLEIATPTTVEVSVTPVQSLNIDDTFVFSTDPSDYTSAPGPVTIGSCATDPTNTTCSTPPPPSSPTSTQQIPPLPIENFFGEATGQTFLEETIATATAAAGVGTAAAVAIYDALAVTEAVFCDW